jgi:hypothetical protein
VNDGVKPLRRHRIAPRDVEIAIRSSETSPIPPNKPMIPKKKDSKSVEAAKKKAHAGAKKASNRAANKGVWKGAK